MKTKITVITPVLNPSEIQIGRLKIAYAAISKNVGAIFFIALNTNSANKDQIYKLNNDFANLKIFEFDDKGPDDAISRLMPHIKTDYLWLLTCGEQVKVGEGLDLVIRDEPDFIIGVTQFIHPSWKKLSTHADYKRYYKYKIPILNLCSCIIKRSIVSEAGGLKSRFNYASDYDIILRIFEQNPTIRFTSDIILDYYIDGRSEINKVKAFAEMFNISRNNFPEIRMRRHLFYWMYCLRHRVSLLSFYRELNKVHT